MNAEPAPRPQAFTEAQLERYSRHILLKQVGGKGQRKLREASVLVVGAGGLGSPVLSYLAAAGVGRLGVVDADRVDLSNLQRQIIHRTEDVGRPKVESAARAIQALNPDVEVVAHRVWVNEDNVRDLIAGYDVVIDGVDNFPTRYLLNDACVLAGKPLVEAGIQRFDGMVTTILPGKGPCYRCIFPDPPAPGSIPSCQEAGVIGAVAGVMGVLQANEALKLILGIGEPLVGRLLVFDALGARFHEFALGRQPHCRLCGEHPTITTLEEYALDCSLHLKAAGGEGMSERRLALTQAQLDAIIAHCRREAPLEACGLITGRAGQARRVWPARNLLASPEGFQVDPQDQLAALRTAWAEGDDLVAIYHSHPATPARPSARDIAEAFYPEAAYLIVSLQDGVSAKAFSIVDGKVSPVEIVITSPDPDGAAGE